MLSNKKLTTPGTWNYTASTCNVLQPMKARNDADVAEMAEQHDVKQILQLAKKYVADVQDMIYGK